MALEHNPLLGSYAETMYTPSRQYHLNRTMSLQAALLAFPLPPPLPPPRSPSLPRSRATYPLKTYNSNYTRLTQARALRVQQRQSLNSKSPYAIPSRYDAIEREFPQHPPNDTSSVQSMTVKIDYSAFEIFEDPPVKTRRLSRRATLLSSGSVAHSQNLRKNSSRKPQRAKVGRNI